jgi:hypothetical protein
MERRILASLCSVNGARLPDPAPDIGQRVGEFVLGANTVPAVLGRAERHVLAFAVRAESQAKTRPRFVSRRTT